MAIYGVGDGWRWSDLSAVQRQARAATTRRMRNGVERRPTLSGIATASRRSIVITTVSHADNSFVLCHKHTRNKPVIDSAPGVATGEDTLSARKVVPCVRWPANGITAHSL